MVCACICVSVCVHTQEGLSDDEAALGNSAFWGSFTVGRVLGVSDSTLGQSSTAQYSAWEHGATTGTVQHIAVPASTAAIRHTSVKCVKC